MHKARENNNGSFSIGKTWVLDDLTAIESFTANTSSGAEDQQRKEWAGGVGFTVTIQKPYYWQASTSKEKDFFIASLIKIYRKYTGGKIPQLLGFEPYELQQIAPDAPQQSVVPQPSLAPETAPASKGVSRTPPPSRQAPTPPQIEPSREPSRERSGRPSIERAGKSESRDRAQRIPGQYPSSDSVRQTNRQDSQASSKDGVSESSATSNTRNVSPAPPRPPKLKDDASLKMLAGDQSADLFRSGWGFSDSKEPPNGRSDFERFKTNGNDHSTAPDDAPDEPRRRSPAPSQSSTSSRNGLHSAPQPSKDQIPERRRPPISRTGTAASQKSHAPSSIDDAGPLDSHRDDIPIPSRSSNRQGRDRFDQTQDRVKPRDYSNEAARPATGNKESSQRSAFDPANPLASKDGNDQRPATSSGVTSTLPFSPPESPAEPPGEQAHRPGLGPMIKKKSQKDIANTFRKVATAHNAFKPRAGRAIERLKLDSQGRSISEPDGINGVVPAPSPFRSMSHDGLKTPTTGSASNAPLPLRADSSESIKGPVAPGQNDIIERPAQELPVVVPEVKVTVTSPGPASPDTEPLKTGQQIQEPIASAGTATTIVLQEERRRKKRTDHAEKYANALGINTSLLEGRTLDFESTLSDFGWSEERRVDNSFEELQTGIRRDLAKVETGSWLGNFEHNDERVFAVGAMLDKAIAECEELDTLLTLYNVELGVSQHKVYVMNGLC